CSERKRQKMNATNKSFRFEKATVQQLMVIVRYEDCAPEVRNAALQMLIMKGVADVWDRQNESI
ncbi:hypothetical protein, partial [Bacillus amyloliquefaciens]|uniref:hypothetical protein n=2 Tax=Bacillus amyloliquefaciens group TaxID=1938374 RepID=UPI00093DE2C8